MFLPSLLHLGRVWGTQQDLFMSRGDGVVVIQRFCHFAKDKLMKKAHVREPDRPHWLGQFLLSNLGLIPLILSNPFAFVNL